MNDLTENVSAAPDITSVPPVTPSEPFDAEKRVGQFIKLRDLMSERKEAHKRELEPIVAAMTELEDMMLAQINTIGADSINTASGTVYKTKKESASVADMEAFWAYIVATGRFELLDRKANVTNVREFIEQKVDQGNAPPGVNFSSINKVNVRRK